MSNKIRGVIDKISFEFLAELLDLPKDIEIIGVNINQHQELVSFIIASPQPIKGYTCQVAEGAELPCRNMLNISRRKRDES